MTADAERFEYLLLQAEYRQPGAARIYPDILYTQDKAYKCWSGENQSTISGVGRSYVCKTVSNVLYS